ncbi:hypothetical protein [Roseateles oligotrophus]|uniref:Uncharacterized protein n=1 Tax=Roseateles oligotrophus TaxID=1769250 RepID=A0ABT2YD96_9BURK|nr:hypothetical protein [Roseateles oligotrophus]MCV2368007.1 hypothetical protein [Roseateles oligotrophus]
MRERGWGLFAVLLLHVPTATLLRVWRVFAQRLDGGRVQQAFNLRRFVRFQGSLPNSALPRFYVIVMPFTLHFLLPCLALLKGRADLVLLSNGARQWERDLLIKRFPDLPMFVLRTVPWASIEHGHVINLLLENHRGNFGIIDHDCYVFDGAIFDQLKPAADECLLSLFGEESRSVEFTFPLTFLLFFNAEPLRLLMRRFGIGAQLYREIPPSARSAMAQIGLGERTFWKSYHNFRDTLHVLLGVALAQGQQIKFLSSQEDLPAMHVGGTSIGSHHAKSLPALYIHLRFLELLNDPVLNRRYAHLTAPLRASADALAHCDRQDPAWNALPVVDTLMLRLRERLSAREQ